MCGIVGFISNSNNSDLILSMTKSMTHRGPDDINTAIYPIGDKFLHLGSARLSITGLKDGAMPMEDKHGNVLIYNGEIYELEKLRFNYSLDLTSKSDTRHLLNILSSQNIDEINNLNGMYAFAYYDKENQKIVLGRDKLGIKPLYFGSNNNYNFYFSSEIKPLISHNIIDNRITENSITNYLYSGGINKLEGLYDELNSQIPGSITEYKNNKIIKNNNLKTNYKNPLNKTGSIQEFNSLFSNALNDQLNAEVPVNILLSGGVDSSLVALFAKKFLNRDVTAYSLGYENEIYNESNEAEKISNELDINLVKFNFPQNKNESLIDELINKLPEPIADPSIIPSYYLSKRVSEFTKVVISGDGADELFGGYEWYRGVLVSKYIPNSFSPLLNLISKIKTQQKDYISQQDKIRLLSIANHLQTSLKVMLWQNYIPSEELERQILFYKNYINKLKFKENLDINDLRLFEMNNYLYSNILKKSDISSMLNSLEVRPVFLDDRIVNYALNFQNRSNFNFIKSKIFLKKILRDEIKDYKFKKKHGFAHDFGEWSHKVGIKYLNDNWREVEEVDRFISYLEKNNDNEYFISRNVWKFYSLFKWMDLNRVKI
tara:strand:- start:12232 stop:14037 length:1806 start_codon:yes stop_codon:yes gene_type:complete